MLSSQAVEDLFANPVLDLAWIVQTMLEKKVIHQMYKHPFHTGTCTQVYVCVYSWMKTKILFSKRFFFLIGMFYGENVSSIEFFRSSSAMLSEDHK